MTTEPQASTDPVVQAGAGGDNPSGSSEPGSQGSAAAQGSAPATADHRALADLSPEQIERFLEEHPQARSYIARKAKSQFDRWAYDQTRRQQAAEADRQAKEDRERLLQKDPLDVGQEIQERLRKEAESAPFRDQYRREGFEQGYARGLEEGATGAYSEVRGILDQKSTYWKGLSPAERGKLVDQSPTALALFDQVFDREADGRAEQRLKKERSKVVEMEEREERAVERRREPSPDVGGGAPATNDTEFLAAFAAGRSMDFARAKRLLNM